jgi:stage II sporulation protein M
MRQIKLGLQRLNIMQIAAALLVLGLVMGVLTANIFKGYYMDQMSDYFREAFYDISEGDINYSGLFFRITGDNLGELALFWIFCITIIGIPYIVLKLIAMSFSAGFFISAVAMLYGFKGIWLVLAYIFPHWLIYLPVYYLCFSRGYTLCRSIYAERRDYPGAIISKVRQYVPLFLILAALILVAGFLEAFVGSFLLKKALGLYIK